MQKYYTLSNSHNIP